MEVSEVIGVPPNHPFIPFIDGFSLINHPAMGTLNSGTPHIMCY
jgi:hypothetical protein